MTESAHRFRPVHQLLAGLIALALFGALTIGVKRGLLLVAWDADVSTQLHQHARAHPQLAALLAGVTFVSERLSIGVEGLAGLLLLAALGRWRAVWIWGLAFLGNIVGHLLKDVVDRARPVFSDPLLTIASRSYPSGHAVGSLLIFGTLLYLIFQYRPGRALLLAPVLGGLIVAIDFSRVYLGVHWLSDVLGGFLFGLGWLLTMAGLVNVFAERRPCPK